MKKYLTLAAILGVIAFVGFSYFAQAEEHAAPAAADTFQADHDACMAGATGADDAAKHAAYEKCMMDHHHTAEEMKAHEAPAAH